MSIQDTIRAWKDKSYRESLSEEQRAQLLENPVGDVLSEEELQAVTGGMKNPCATDSGGWCSCTGIDGCINTGYCSLDC